MSSFPSFSCLLPPSTPQLLATARWDGRCGSLESGLYCQTAALYWSAGLLGSQMACWHCDATRSRLGEVEAVCWSGEARGGPKPAGGGVRLLILASQRILRPKRGRTATSCFLSHASQGGTHGLLLESFNTACGPFSQCALLCVGVTILGTCFYVTE